MPWTILDVLSWTQKRFAERGLPSARLDAEVLLAHVLGSSRVALYTGFDKPLQERELASYRELIRRRLAGEPVAYLVGTQEFWSMTFAVDARVLIPRRDSETLVETALRLAPGARRIADIGTGSGALVLALLKELPEATAVACDASEGALEVARANADRHGLAARLTLVRGDLVAPLEGSFDLMVANPPYVPRGDLATLSPEVRREPRAALDGGPDGLDLLRRLIPAARGRLRPGGWLVVEHGFDQGERVRALFIDAGYAQVATQSDLAGNPRVSYGLLPAAP